MKKLEISNRQARWLWLSSQGLAVAPTGSAGPEALDALVTKLGLVQLDTIQTVARAHDHILWSRCQRYRPGMMDPLYRQRRVFEHFTHDASVLPMSLLPLWRRQFGRLQSRLNGNWYKGLPGPEARAAIRNRIAQEGALSTRDFESDAPRKTEMWARTPHKLALDYMWYGGELGTCHRRGFEKFYDVEERIFPAGWREDGPDGDDLVDGLCAEALDRMGFGTLGEVRKFWDATEVAEVKAWAGRADLVEISVEAADGARFDAVAPADIEARLAELEKPTSRLRILNPFDPVIRDRVRLERLFGFDYRNEMFVPQAKRRWGYYVFPLLEGDRLVGRLEAKAHRKLGTLEVLNLWQEAGVRWGQGRIDRLRGELSRLARFAGVQAVTIQRSHPKFAELEALTSE